MPRWCGRLIVLIVKVVFYVSPDLVSVSVRAARVEPHNFEIILYNLLILLRFNSFMWFGTIETIKARNRGRTANKTAKGAATLEEFNSCIVALMERRWKSFNGTQADVLPSLSNLRRKHLEPEKGSPLAVPFAVPFAILFTVPPVCRALRLTDFS